MKVTLLTDLFSGVCDFGEIRRRIRKNEIKRMMLGLIESIYQDETKTDWSDIYNRISLQEVTDKFNSFGTQMILWIQSLPPNIRSKVPLIRYSLCRASETQEELL